MIGFSLDKRETYEAIEDFKVPIDEIRVKREFFGVECWVGLGKLGNEIGIEVQKAFDFGFQDFFLVFGHLVVPKSEVKRENVRVPSENWGSR